MRGGRDEHHGQRVDESAKCCYVLRGPDGTQFREQKLGDIGEGRAPEGDGGQWAQ